MPHLRFTRDRRGYENTFLVHRDRSGRHERSSILYWFRTPPDIRVGRAALDEGAIRELERGHPHIRFDWPRILEVQPVVPSGVPEPAPARGGARQGAPPSRRSPPEPREVAATPPPSPVSSNEEVGHGEEALDSPDEPLPDRSAPRLTAAARTFDAEALGRLRARYAEVLARISSHSETERSDDLRQMAERLNPDAWVTDEDVRAGLESFEQTLEALRRVLGPLFRRSRVNERRGRRQSGSSPE